MTTRAIAHLINRAQPLSSARNSLLIMGGRGGAELP
jgi:hypothetical protein